VQRQMLKPKPHRARVTGCDPDYVGSISLGPELMQAAAYAPVVVHVDDRNEIARVDSHPEVLLDSPLASHADFAIPGEL
jgi:aspartate 1-decarboxylase